MAGDGVAESSFSTSFGRLASGSGAGFSGCTFVCSLLTAVSVDGFWECRGKFGMAGRAGRMVLTEEVGRCLIVSVGVGFDDGMAVVEGAAGFDESISEGGREV